MEQDWNLFYIATHQKINHWVDEECISKCDFVPPQTACKPADCVTDAGAAFEYSLTAKEVIDEVFGTVEESEREEHFTISPPEGAEIWPMLETRDHSRSRTIGDNWSQTDIVNIAWYGALQSGPPSDASLTYEYLQNDNGGLGYTCSIHLLQDTCYVRVEYGDDVLFHSIHCQDKHFEIRHKLWETKEKTYLLGWVDGVCVDELLPVYWKMIRRLLPVFLSQG